MVVVKLKELAQAKGYESISDFQRASGAAIGTVRRWWKNETYDVDFEVLELFCNFLECTPNDLIKVIPNKKPKN